MGDFVGIGDAITIIVSVGGGAGIEEDRVGKSVRCYESVRILDFSIDCDHSAS